MSNKKRSNGIDHMFKCGRHRDKSPSVGIPVALRPEACEKNGFPFENRGGTIIEDLSFTDISGKDYYLFKVRHANGDFVWSREELIEIGAQIEITIAPNIIPDSEDDR